MRQQVQWPPNQEGSGSPSSNPVILRSPETRQPRLWQPASPSSRKPPTLSESRTPAASRPGVARRTPAQPRSGPRSPAVATKPKMLRTLSKEQTFDQSSQSNQRKGLKATRTKKKSASTPARSGASSRFPNCAPNQIITAGSTSRTRCPYRLPT